MTGCKAVGAALILAGCSTGEVSMTYVTADTVRSDLSAHVTQCPSGEGWLLEAVDSIVTILIWLPADSAKTWVPLPAGPANRPRAVLQQLGRAGIDTWLADSGEIQVVRGPLGYRGRFTLFGRYQRASGTFRARRAEVDTAACVPPAISSN